MDGDSKDTAEARAEREVHEAAKKTVKIRKHKSLDWAKRQFQWKDPSHAPRPILKSTSHIF